MASLFILSETAPASPSNGQGWIKSSTGQVYQYLNSAWRPLIGGSAQSMSSPLTVLLNGANKTTDIGSLVINDILTRQVDTCTFTFDSDSSYEPETGEEVVIYNSTTKIFGGNIVNVSQVQRYPGSSYYIYSVECVDFSHKLKKELVIETYTSTLAGTIIKDIIDNYCQELSYNNVLDGIIINYIQFNYKNPFDCIQEICDRIGYDFYVDYDKDLHFFSRETNTAPYSITSSLSTSGHNNDLVINVDISQLKNIVIIQGSYYLSDDYDDIQEVKDNTETSWSLRYTPYAADSGSVEAYINTGGGYAAVDLGIDNIDDGTGDDLLINQAEKVIREGADYDATAGDLIKITYKRRIDIITADKNKASIRAMKLLEGGEGEYIYHEYDEKIKTIEAAHDKARGILTNYANPLVTGSFRTDQSGYKSGQLITITAYGYNNTYVIQEVTTEWIENDYIEYTVTFASKLLGLTDFLAELYKSSKEDVINENETTHKLELLDDEEITMDDESSIDVDIGLPFEYGPGGNRQAKYNSIVQSIESTSAIYGA